MNEKRKQLISEIAFTITQTLQKHFHTKNAQSWIKCRKTEAEIMPKHITVSEQSCQDP